MRRPHPRQNATNGFDSHSRPIVVSSVWPGSTRSSGARVIRPSITERRTTSAGPPPTASLNNTSPLKHTSSLTTNATPSSEWPGNGIARDRQPSGHQVSRHDGDRRNGRRALPRAPRGRDGRASATDASVSGVRARRVRATGRAALRCPRRRRRLPAPRRHVCIGQPPGVHRTGHEHGGNATTLTMPVPLANGQRAWLDSRRCAARHSPPLVSRDRPRTARGGLPQRHRDHRDARDRSGRSADVDGLHERPAGPRVDR